MENNMSTIAFSPVSEMTTEALYEELKQINEAVTTDKAEFNAARLAYARRAKEVYQEFRTRMIQEKASIDELLKEG